ncbi:hypothetical protein LTS08_007895 [Lithohypha guttulata]|nr:hypothetical protein LTS08_007895 [Lithohypha guttulata]
MDGGSPVDLDSSWQYDIPPDENDNDHDIHIETSGVSASHDAPDGKQYRPTMKAIGSMTENTGNQSSPATKLQQHLSEKPDDGEEHTPAWIELKTKAGKERKRLPLACIACRRKKIKCSGEKPACKHCLKARTPCVYKVTTRKAAPRTDYMAMLDRRLKRMEDRVIKIIPKEDLPDTSQRSSVRPPLPGTRLDERNEETGKRPLDEAFERELRDWSKPRTGSTQLDTAAKTKTFRDSENRLFTEGVDALPPSQIQEHLAEVFFDCVYGQAYLLLHKPSFMRKLKAGAVPPVLMLSICAISARFSTHPHMDTEPAFLRGEQWATPARSIVEKRHFEPNITILTCMVILGLHYFGTCEGGLSWSFGGQAMRMGYALQLHKELDHDSLGVAQAERAAASGKPVPQIPELSFLDREIRRRTMWACYLMDTFNSSGTERPSFLNEDYFFIQLPVKELHFQMEIPSHTEDINGHTPLNVPSDALDDSTNDVKSNMGVAAYLIRAVVIWKRVVRYLNLGGKEKDPYPIWDPLSQFAVLQRQITQLKSSLPPSLEYNQENLQIHVTERVANQFIFLHIVIAQNSLFLHRFAIPTAPNTHRPYPPNTPKSFLATAATTVLDAASHISNLLGDSTGHTLTAPFAGYCAYASATVHIWGIFSRNLMLEKSSRDCLRHNYRYLDRMKRYWGMFHYMAESIRDVYRLFADAAARANKAPQSKLIPMINGQADVLGDGAVTAEQNSRAASPSLGKDLDDDSTRSKPEAAKVQVFQYGDWFNKYPHGVSEQEWEKTRLPHRSETQKGTEAVMSQRAESQSVEEFFASLTPPSKADEGPSKKKPARKRGKSMAESTKTKELNTEHSRKQPPPSRTQSMMVDGTKTPRPNQPLSSASLYPLSERNWPHLGNANPDIDVPMSGVSAGLQSGQGNSAFDLSSPSSLFPAFHTTTALTSNPQQNQHNSPFEYTSPASSSNTASVANNTNSSISGMSFNFNYTSAVPQLDRAMVFGGYSGIDPAQSGATNALNNPNIDFWMNPWDASIGSVDVDGFSGFNDPSLGLSAGTGPLSVSSTSNADDRRRSSAQQQHPQQRDTKSIYEDINRNLGNTSQHQNMSSTAWFMPFNIEPPNASLSNHAGGMTMDTNTGLGTSDLNDFGNLDMMDLREWAPFSPGLGSNHGGGDL